jgi:small conductance mechanosensitive channel
MTRGSEMLHLDYYLPQVFNLARIALVLIFAFISTRAMGRLLRGLRNYIVKMMLKAGSGNQSEIEKRVQTVSGLARKASFFLVWTVALIMILRELNFEIWPLVTGAGVIGVAVGFGAQSVIKDVLSGLFLLMENQIRVNDVAVINGKSGLVEEINLRTTVLRAEDGAVHIFAIELLKEIAGQLQGEEPYHSAILAPLDVMGVDQLGDFAVLIKARFKTLPGQQWLIGREMNRRIKQRFEDAHIDMPFPTRTVHVISEMSPELRSELKQVVREVIKEG